MSNPVNGRGPNGRALNKDGTERAERTTLTPAQKAMKARQAVIDANKSIGRDILKADKASEPILATVGLVKKWNRECAEYATPEKRAAKAAYFQRQIDNIEGKGEASEAYLGTSDLSALDTLETSVGEAAMVYMDDHGCEMPVDEAATLCASLISDEIRVTLEAAADPANDPFVDFRRNADSDDSENDNADTLD